MSHMNNNKTVTRPVYLDLTKIRQPITAITSIGHRISGVLLFLSIPLVIWMLERSLHSPDAYAQLMALLDKPLMSLILLVMAWAASHHFFAGIRFLLLDIEWGVDLETARKTAKVVNILGVVGVLVAMVFIL